MNFDGQYKVVGVISGFLLINNQLGMNAYTSFGSQANIEWVYSTVKVLTDN